MDFAISGKNQQSRPPGWNYRKKNPHQKPLCHAKTKIKMKQITTLKRIALQLIDVI